MKKLFCFVLLLLFTAAAIIGCAPSGPTITPPITVVEPAPSATAVLNPNISAVPSSTFQPSDDFADDNNAEPLSEKDFVVSLPEGDFNLLTQNCADLEAMTGLKFKSKELQAGGVLFTKLESYIDSAFFLQAPTPRGVKQGDSLEAMLEAYGTPSEINDFDDSASYIFYIAHDDTDAPADFTSQRPLWYYAVGFSVSDGKVDSAFIADWSTG